MEKNDSITDEYITSLLQSLSSDNQSIPFNSFTPKITNIDDITVSQLWEITKFTSNQAGLWEVNWMYSRENAPNVDAKKEMDGWNVLWDIFKDGLIKQAPQLEEEIIKGHSSTVLALSIEKSLELRKSKPIENKIAEMLSKISLFFNKLGFKKIATRLYTMALYPKGSIGRT